MIFALCLLLNPYAGTYHGEWRAGFVNPKPLTVDIASNGWTVATTGAVLRTGWTRSDGTFTWSHAPAVWDGSFEWQGSQLVGVFTASGGSAPVAGVMWLDPD